MDDLAREYEGRARVARFIIMTQYGALPSVEIRDKYEIYAVPIVILFNKGVEVKRWVVVALHDSCRNELDKLMPPPGRRSDQGSGVAKPRAGSSPPPDALPARAPRPTGAKPPEIAH